MDTPKFAGFEILETMPQGAMGTVYKALQISLDRIVALKMLSPELAVDSADVEQFFAEARIAANLKHPNIVQVYDFGKTEEGIYYFVMEFISGYSIGEWIRRKRVLTEENALLVSQSVAEALEYAWSKDGVIHCDIKPDNIMVDGDGTVKVADLGLARSLNSIVDRSKADKDVVCGTPNYISPEQSQGGMELDFRADVYSLGATIYHCMTGTIPFEGEPLIKVMDLQISDQIPEPQELNPNLSAASSCLIEKMLAKDRSHRQESWAEVLEDISRVINHKMPAVLLSESCKSTVRRRSQSDQHPIQKPVVVPRSKTEQLEMYADNDAFSDMERKFGRKQKQSTLSKPEWLAAGAIGVAIMVLAILIFQANLSKPPGDLKDTTVSDSPYVDGSVNESGVLSAEQEQDKIAGEIFQRALSMAARHQENHDEAIKILKKAAEELEGTPFIEKALVEIGILEEAKRDAVASLVNRLDERADELGARNRYGEASDLFERYEGPLAVETAEARRARSQEWRAKLSALEEQKLAMAQAEQWQDTIRKVAVALVDGNPDLAFDHVRSISSDAVPEERKDDLQNLQKILSQAVQIDARVLSYFRSKKEQEVIFMLPDGAEKLTIREVHGDRIDAAKIVKVGSGHISYPKTVRVSDLTPSQKILCLGDSDQPGTALMQGLVFVQAGDLASARSFFATSEIVLANALIDEIKRRDIFQTEENARRALARLMRMVQINIPEELPSASECLAIIRGHKFSNEHINALAQTVSAYRNKFGETSCAGEYKQVLRALENVEIAEPERPSRKIIRQRETGNADSVRTLLLNANPGLTHDNVVFETDTSGRVTGVMLRSPALRDIQPLSLLSDLEKVVCSGHMMDAGVAALADISALKGLSLRELNVSRTKVKDVSVLADMPLERLNLSFTDVDDVRRLARLPLTELDISQTAVRDIRALHGMKLVELHMSGTDVDTVLPLQGMPLSIMHAARTKIRHITALHGMSLKILNLNNTNIGDISSLRGMPLEHLEIGGTQVRDFTPLTGMPLEYLDITGLNMRNLSVLEGMRLKHLRAGNTRVSDLSPLKGMPLMSLNISNNNVKDLSPLQTMPLRVLDMDATAVNSLDDIRGMSLRRLNISRNNISDLSPLAGMPLRFLNLTGTGVRNLLPIRNLPIEHILIDHIHLRYESDSNFMQVLGRMPSLIMVNNRRYSDY